MMAKGVVRVPMAVRMRAGEVMFVGLRGEKRQEFREVGMRM